MNRNGKTSFMYIIEGVPQGGDLEMIAYGIGTPPSLIRNLKKELPEATHPWYAYTAGALGKLARIEDYFHHLKQHSPGRGYCPEPLKSVLTAHPENLEAGKQFSLIHGFKVCTSARYPVGYIGDNNCKSN